MAMEHENYGESLEDEWRHVAASYSTQEAFLEWEIPASETTAGDRILLTVNRELEVPDVKRVILTCQRMLPHVVPAILSENHHETLHDNFQDTFPQFSPSDTIKPLFAEFEALLHQSGVETEAFESEYLGEDEWNGELSAAEVAKDLALTEVLAAEAVHAEMESEAQSLLGSALPITFSMMEGTQRFKNVIPVLTRSNSRLIHKIFQSGPESRKAFALLPAVHRRMMTSLKLASEYPTQWTPKWVNRLYAAQTAKMFNSPSLMGKTLSRNRALRNTTMPMCANSPKLSP